jgi:hypothetical protein
MEFNIWDLILERWEDDPVRSEESMLDLIQEIQDEQTHLHLKADLVEHVWRRTNQQAV